MTQASVADAFVTVQEFEEIFSDRQWNLLERILLPPQERKVELGEASEAETQQNSTLKHDVIKRKNNLLKRLLARGDASMRAAALNSKSA